MKNNTFIFVFHVLQLILNLQMLYWNLAVSNLPYLIQNFFFLTIFTHTSLCVLNILTLICDISIINNHNKANPTKFQGVRYPQYIFRLYQGIMGIGGVVVIGYWGLRIFKRELIFKDGVYEVPELLASYSHGGNLLVLAMELTMYDHAIFESFKEKFRNYGLFMIFYIFLQFTHFLIYEVHIYPFIKIMNLSELIAFEGSLFLVSLLWDLLFTKILVRTKWAEIELREKNK